jgi:hypothetical protein
VTIGTDVFVQNFVAKTRRVIIDDVKKLKYTNSHILLRNRCVLKKQNVDFKIDDTLLKKGIKQHTDGWDTTNKVWTHMVLHLSYDEGGFGVTFTFRILFPGHRPS